MPLAISIYPSGGRSGEPAKALPFTPENSSFVLAGGKAISLVEPAFDHGWTICPGALNLLGISGILLKMKPAAF